MANNVLRQKLTRQIAAFLCCVLLLTVIVGQLLHTLSAHHDEHKPYCHAEPGATHLHTSDYGHHLCALCDLTLAPVAGFGVFHWQLPPQTPDLEAAHNFYLSPVGVSPLTLPALRGPPAMA